MSRVVCVALLFLVACAGPPQRKIPALTPEQAAALLHYNSKAETWLAYVNKNNRNCRYELDLPDQTSQPTQIDLNHIVVCGNRPAPREFDASVSFAYDKNRQTWVITRFAD